MSKYPWLRTLSCIYQCVTVRLKAFTHQAHCFILKKHTVKALKLASSDNELVLMFLNKKRNKQRKSSSRENFMVWSRTWSCIMTTFVHISGGQWSSVSSSWQNIWGGRETFSDSWLTWSRWMFWATTTLVDKCSGMIGRSDLNKNKQKKCLIWKIIQG